MKSILNKKTYYLITNPDLPGMYVENFGDRIFKMYGEFSGYSLSQGIAINGDVNWEINETHILACADAIFEEKIKQLKDKNAKKVLRPYQCQKCGENIGYVGRFITEPIFGKQHKCESK